MVTDTHKRRWNQFSLKTLLVVMTVFVVLLGGGFAIWRFVDEYPLATGGPYSVHQDGSPPLDEQRVATAREALEHTYIYAETGSKGIEDIYRWSRRLMESIADAPNCTAPERVKAIEEHLDRMRKLQERYLKMAHL